MKIVATGSEIIECLRIARMIERHGEQFLNRVYTTAEIRYCQSRKLATQHFAAVWAGKEAVLRALGTTWRRGIGWLDIELRHDAPGRTAVELRGGARDLMESLDISDWQVSIAHCRTHAVGHAIALAGDAMEEDEDE